MDDVVESDIIAHNARARNIQVDDGDLICAVHADEFTRKFHRNSKCKHCNKNKSWKALSLSQIFDYENQEGNFFVIIFYKL